MNISSISSPRIKITAWAIAACLAATLAGCGSGAATSASGGNATTDAQSVAVAASAADARKPCDYIKRADAEAAVGVALPQTNEIKEMNECDYNSPEFYGTHLTVGDWDGLKQYVVVNGLHSTPVSGVGDEAMNVGRSNDDPHLYVRKGARGFMLSLTSPQTAALPDRGLERAKTLALKILPGF